VIFIGHLSDLIDLSACDLLLWRYLKSKIYALKSGNIEELKDKILREIACTPLKVIKECLRRDDLHRKDMIFKNK
jgi:hypothetical protein